MAYTVEEEQEINQFKEWWKNNYKAIIVVFVLTLVGVYGWRYWQQYQVNQIRELSVQYEALIAGESKKNKQAFDTFVQEHNGTAYAIFALLERAKDEVAMRQFKQAEVLLEKAIQQSQDNILTSVIALRLAAVQFQLKKYDDAEKTLQKVQGKVWVGQKWQLQGNIELAKGNVEKAKNAFRQALSLANPMERPMIQVRLNNLG